MVYLGIPDERRLTVDHLNQHTAQGPHVDLGCVVGGAENELGGSVAPGTDIGEVGLSLDELLGRSEVADNSFVAGRVE